MGMMIIWGLCGILAIAIAVLYTDKINEPISGTAIGLLGFFGVFSLFFTVVLVIFDMATNITVHKGESDNGGSEEAK